MRIAPIIIFLWVFAFGISLFQSTSQYDYEYQDFFSENASSNDSDVVRSILMYPDEFANSQGEGVGGDLFNSIFIWVAVGGGLFVAAGALMRSDMVLLGGFLTVLIGMGVTPILMIYSWMRDEFGMLMCPGYTLAPGAAICAPALLTTTVLLGMPVYMYVMAVFEWWTSRPLTR